MQKQGGGSKATPSQRGGKQRGGGNDPSCGCDMQAGWPPASEFPRGGLQGGGLNFNEFNLALTKNGKTRHLKGQWNTEMNENENMNENMNENQFMNENMNENMNETMNMGTTNQNKSVKTNNKKRNKTNKKRGSSAPNGYSNLAYKGEKYLKNNTSGEVFQITEKGTIGNSMGYYVTPKSGKPYMTQMPPPLETETLEQQMNRLSQPITPMPKSQGNIMRTQLPPELDMSDDYETEPPEGETVSNRKSLSQKGGKRRKYTRKGKQTKRRMTRRRRT
jgi:hypothetical protein